MTSHVDSPDLPEYRTELAGELAGEQWIINLTVKQFAIVTIHNIMPQDIFILSQDLEDHCSLSFHFTLPL